MAKSLSIKDEIMNLYMNSLGEIFLLKIHDLGIVERKLIKANLIRDLAVSRKGFLFLSGDVSNH